MGLEEGETEAKRKIERHPAQGGSLYLQRRKKAAPIVETFSKKA